MRQSFGVLVLFVCPLLIKAFLSDDNIANNLLNKQSPNGQSELTELPISWPTKVRKSVTNSSSKQVIESPLTSFNTSQTALDKYQGDTNKHVNNSLINLKGINLDLIRSFWSFIQGKHYIVP